MARFKTRNNKNEDGTYTLSYGKGGRKLTAAMRKTADGEWIVEGLDSVYSTMRDAKETWGAMAQQAYKDGTPVKDDTPASPPEPKEPAPPKRPTPPPPSLKKAGPPSLKRRPKPAAPESQPTLDTHAADPFDPRMRYPSDHPRHPKKLTPLGVLVEIQSWCSRYRERINKTNKRLVSDGESPAYNPFYYLEQGVNDCLERELEHTHGPEEDPGTTDREAEADADADNE